MEIEVYISASSAIHFPASCLLKAEALDATHQEKDKAIAIYEDSYGQKRITCVKDTRNRWILSAKSYQELIYP